MLVTFTKIRQKFKNTIIGVTAKRWIVNTISNNHDDMAIIKN